jgi:UDP-N-acetylglucosamine acyltransferase
MANTQPARIHPTAIISPEAELADDVVVGPYAIIDGRAHIAAGCVFKAHALVTGAVTIGRNNRFFSGSVIGEQPQHLKYNGEPTSVEIGDDNVFRENVTVHRGTTASMVTRIGNGNYFMAGSHVAHDCVIGNRSIFANGTLIAGHCTIDDSVFMSGNSAVHQFVRVGRLALVSGNSGSTKDVPPFVILQHINCVAGVNVVGMRRAGMTHEQINGVRRAFQLIFRQGSVLPTSLVRTEAELGHIDVVMEMVTFIRNSKRGINLLDDHGRMEAA